MLTDWSRWFPDCGPVAHHLSVVFPERWVRFHSLPGSKRYPSNPAEYATALHRYNRVLGELARSGDTLILRLGEHYPAWLAPEWLKAGESRDVSIDL